MASKGSKPRYRVGQVVFNKQQCIFGRIKKRVGSVIGDGLWQVHVRPPLDENWFESCIRPLRAREQGKD